MPFNLRKPFVRRQTDHPVIEETDSNAVPTGTAHDVDGKPIPNTELNETAISSGVDQLEKFKKSHKWDYNLDYDTIVRPARPHHFVNVNIASDTTTGSR